MTLLWLIIWYVAGHAALQLDPVGAWTATLILAVGLDLARPSYAAPKRGG